MVPPTWLPGGQNPDLPEIGPGASGGLRGLPDINHFYGKLERSTDELALSTGGVGGFSTHTTRRKYQSGGLLEKPLLQATSSRIPTGTFYGALPLVFCTNLVQNIVFFH